MIYEKRKSCKFPNCLAMAEHELIDMDLCQYHFIKLSNELFSKDGIDRIPELMRLLD